MINSIKQFLGLSFSLAVSEFKLRNEGSYLGIFWYLLNPVLMFILLMAVFSANLGTGIPSYPIYLLIGIIMFNFFQKTTIESTKIIMQHNAMIKSIKFPHNALIGSIVLKTLFSHFFEIIVLAVFLVLFGVPLSGLIFYPLILVFFCLFVYGASLLLSSLNVYFTDLESIWVFFSTLVWFATPIFYAVEQGTKQYSLNLFNPIYYFITIARDAVVYGKTPESWMIAGMIIFTLVALFIGSLVFGKLKNKFAEMI